jgi:hypothetical protein
MKRTVIATIIAAAFAAPAPAPAHAQDAPVVIMQQHHLAAADAPHAQADAWQRWADDFSHEMRASMGTMFAPRMSSAKVVKGAPYTAEMITESTQSLADGNSITRKKTGLVFRDGDGRTRQETGADGKGASIFITDPVEGKHYVLTPGSKRAITIPRVAIHEGTHKSKQVIRSGGTEVRIEDGKVFIDGKEAAAGNIELTSRSGRKVVVKDGKVTIDGKEVGHGSGSGSTVIVNRHEGADGMNREEVHVRVVRAGDDTHIPVPPMPPMPPTPPGALAPLPPMPPMPGIQTMRFESIARLGKGVTTSLGTKDFDGVKAEGKSTVWTIPAGEIGNKNPINITSESWYSPDLKVTVQSRYNDPRTGETVYRLANIRRTEPAADLFKVPEEYKSKMRVKG